MRNKKSQLQTQIESIGFEGKNLAKKCVVLGKKKKVKS